METREKVTRSFCRSTTADWLIKEPARSGTVIWTIRDDWQRHAGVKWIHNGCSVSARWESSRVPEVEAATVSGAQSGRAPRGSGLERLTGRARMPCGGSGETEGRKLDSRPEVHKTLLDVLAQHFGFQPCIIGPFAWLLIGPYWITALTHPLNYCFLPMTRLPFQWIPQKWFALLSISVYFILHLPSTVVKSNPLWCHKVHNTRAWWATTASSGPSNMSLVLPTAHHLAASRDKAFLQLTVNTGLKRSRISRILNLWSKQHAGMCPQPVSVSWASIRRFAFLTSSAFEKPYRALRSLCAAVPPARPHPVSRDGCSLPSAPFSSLLFALSCGHDQLQLRLRAPGHFTPLSPQTPSTSPFTWRTHAPPPPPPQKKKKQVNTIPCILPNSAWTFCLPAPFQPLPIPH